MSIIDDHRRMPPELATLTDSIHGGTYLLKMATYEFIEDNEGLFEQINNLHVNNEQFNPSPVILVVNTKIRENDITANIYVKRVDLTGYDSSGNPTYGAPYFSMITQLIPKFTDFDTVFDLETYNVIEIVSIVGKNGKYSDSFEIYGLGDTNIRIFHATSYDDMRDGLYEAYDQRFAGLKLCNYCFATGVDPRTGFTCSTCSGNGQTWELSARRSGLDNLGLDAGIVRWELQKYQPYDTEPEKDARDMLFRHRVHGQRMWIVPRIPDIKAVFATFIDKPASLIRVYDDIGYSHDSLIFDVNQIYENINFSIPTSYYNLTNAQLVGSVVEVVPLPNDDLSQLTFHWTINGVTPSTEWWTVTTRSSLIQGNGGYMQRADLWTYLNSISYDTKSRNRCGAAGQRTLCLINGTILFDETSVEEAIPLVDSSKNNVDGDPISLPGFPYSRYLIPMGVQGGHHCGDRSYSGNMDVGSTQMNWYRRGINTANGSQCYPIVKNTVDDWLPENDAVNGGTYVRQVRGIPIGEMHFDFDLKDCPVWNTIKDMANVTVVLEYETWGSQGYVRKTTYPSMYNQVLDGYENTDVWTPDTQRFNIDPRTSQRKFQIWFSAEAVGQWQQVRRLRCYVENFRDVQGDCYFEYKKADDKINTYIYSIDLPASMDNGTESSITYTIERKLEGEVSYTEDENSPVVIEVDDGGAAYEFVLDEEVIEARVTAVLRCFGGDQVSPSIDLNRLTVTKIDNERILSGIIDVADLGSVGNQNLEFRCQTDYEPSGFYIDNIIFDGYTGIGIVQTNTYEVTRSVIDINWFAPTYTLTDGEQDNEQVLFYYRVGQSQYECENSDWEGPYEDFEIDAHPGEGYRFIQWRVELTPTRTTTPSLNSVLLYLRRIRATESELAGYERTMYGPVWTISLPTTFGPNAWWTYNTNAREMVELAESMVPIGTVVRVEHYLPAEGSDPNYDTVEELNIIDEFIFFNTDLYNFEDDVVGAPPAGWRFETGVGAPTRQVVNTVSYEGNNSLELADGGAAGSLTGSILLTEDNTGSWGVDTRIRRTAVTANVQSGTVVGAVQAHTTLGDPANITLGAVGMLFPAIGTQQFIYYTGGGAATVVPGITWIADRWYRIRIRGNINSQRYWFQITDEVTDAILYELSDIPFYEACTYVRAMGLTFVGFGNDSANIDSIIFTYLG